MQIRLGFISRQTTAKKIKGKLNLASSFSLHLYFCGLELTILIVTRVSVLSGLDLCILPIVSSHGLYKHCIYPMC